MYWPLLQQGSTGENVRTVQYLLNSRGSSLTVDGNFGPLTAAAVSAFQSANGLVADGAVGDATWPVLIVQVSSGSSGDAVRAVQSQIHSRSGWLTIDGSFGPQTQNAVQWFQTPVGLTVDGIVNWYTWHAFVTDYLPAQDGPSAAKSVYAAWAGNDQATAAKNAAPAALGALFARPWHASDGWSFQRCGFATGHFVCTWTRSGASLVLEGNDNTGAPFYYVESATFQP